METSTYFSHTKRNIKKGDTPKLGKCPKWVSGYGFVFLLAMFQSWDFLYLAVVTEIQFTITLSIIKNLGPFKIQIVSSNPSLKGFPNERHEGIPSLLFKRIIDLFLCKKTPLL